MQRLWVRECACPLLSLADRRSRRTRPHFVCIKRSICLEFCKITALPLLEARGKHSPTHVTHRIMVHGSRDKVVLRAVQTGHISVILYKCQPRKL